MLIDTVLVFWCVVVASSKKYYKNLTNELCCFQAFEYRETKQQLYSSKKTILIHQWNSLNEV